jgi:hypothetical protein
MVGHKTVPGGTADWEAVPRLQKGQSQDAKMPRENRLRRIMAESFQLHCHP